MNENTEFLNAASPRGECASFFSLCGSPLRWGLSTKGALGKEGQAGERHRPRLCLGRWLFVFSFVAFGFSAAAQEQVFERLRGQAKPIDSLSSFLRSYMGDCQAGPEAAACRQKSVAFRQQANQNSYVFMAFENTVAIEIRSMPNGQLNIGWLPFFSAFGYGMASHAPKQWNKEGSPIYSYMYLRGQLPPDTSYEDILRWQRVGRLAAEVIIVPKGMWKAASKSKAKVSLEGMSVTWKAIRIFDSRSGETLGVWVN